MLPRRKTPCSHCLDFRTTAPVLPGVLPPLCHRDTGDLRCVGGLGQPPCCPHANLGVCSRGQGSRPRCVCPWWLNVSEGDVKAQHCVEETLPQSSPVGSGLQLLSIIPISCVAAFISFQISLATFAPPGFVRDDFPHRRRVHFLFYLPSAQLL